MILRYEEFVADPDRQLADVFRFLGLEPHASGLTVRRTINEAYFARWSRNRWSPLKRYDIDRAVDRFEERANRFGYCLRDPGRLLAPAVLGAAAVEH